MEPWFKSFFSSEVWVEFHEARFTEDQTAAQADAIVRLLQLERGARVLDAPCGTGRIARALAARGMMVAGVDLSEPLLARARAAAPDLSWCTGDVRELSFDREFDAAVVVWNSFGYFDPPGDRAFATGLRRALVSGGRLMLDVNATETLLHRVEAEVLHAAGGVLVQEKRTFDPFTGRVKMAWTATSGRNTVQTESSIRLYGCAELCDLLRSVGFSTFSAWGGFFGEPFEVGAGHLVLVAH